MFCWVWKGWFRAGCRPGGIRRGGRSRDGRGSLRGGIRWMPGSDVGSRVDGFGRRSRVRRRPRGDLDGNSCSLVFEGIKFVLDGVETPLQARILLASEDRRRSRVCDRIGVAKVASLSSLVSGRRCHNYFGGHRALCPMQVCRGEIETANVESKWLSWPSWKRELAVLGA